MESMPFEVELRTILEAMLFVGGKPLTVERVRQVIRGVDADEMEDAFRQLSAGYRRQRRPYEIFKSGTEWSLVLRPAFAAVVQRLERQSRTVRLSQASVEVLALVAYKQPVTATEIEATRGADCGAILRQLRRRNLIDQVRRTEGGSHQYGTTHRFLDLFQLSNLEDLPRVEEFERK